MNIKLAETNKTLSPNGGLLLVDKLMTSSGFGNFLKPYLPVLERSADNSLAKLKGFLLSFARGS